MTIKNKQDLEAKIKFYIKAGEYETAKRFAAHYKNMKDFDIESALNKINKAEKAKNPNIGGR